MDKLSRSLKVLSMFMLCILFVNMASAWEFDNAKIYDAQQKEITIKNSFNLPLLSEDVAKIKLNTPLVVKVPRGYQKVAEFDLIYYLDDNGGLDKIDFYDLKNKMSQIDRQFDFKVKEIKQVEVDDQSCEDVLNKNGTIEEVCNISGSHYEDKVEWRDFDAKDLVKEEKITIGVFTDVQKGDYVEWIPTFYGVEIDEWATWEEDWNVGNVFYLPLNESTGNAIDVTGHGFDFTLNGGVTQQASGVIGYGYDFNRGSDGYLHDTIGTALSSPDAFTVSLWFNIDYTVTSPENWGIWGMNTEANGMYAVNSQVIRYYVNTGAGEWYDVALPSSDINGKWIFIVYRFADGVGSHFDYFNMTDQLGDYENASHNNAVYDNPTFWIGSYGDASRDYDGQIDEVSVWNRSLTDEEVQDLWQNYILGCGYGENCVGIDNPANITFNSPTADANYSTEQTITFNFTAWDDINLSNVTVHVNGVLNQTNSSGLNDTVYLFDIDFGDGTFDVFGRATDNASQSTDTGNITIIIDTISPTISTTSNLTDLVIYTLPTNSVWYFNASDPHIDKCYYNTSENATYSIETCNSSITTSWTTEGSKTVQYCANDTFGHETCNSTSITVYYVEEDQADNPDPIAEGSDATFNLTLNMTSIPTTTAYLVLNNTVFSPTTTQAGSDGYYFEVTVNIPDTWGSTTGEVIDWFWNYTINGVVTNESTDTTNITVYELAVDNCSSYGEVILNLSLKDEKTNVFVNESAGANVEIDLTLTSKDNSSITVQYHNTWTNENNPTVCIPSNILNNTEYWIDFTIGFDSTDHVWEFYYLDDGTLNSSKEFNSMTNYTLDLMDLLTTDSTSFLFNYFDQDGLPVDDAIVHVFRKYIGEGEFYEVERSKADQNGDTIVHVVEEDVIYYFIISQYGVPLFTSSTYTALCQTTPCEIQIEASGGFAEFPTDYDLIDGGAISISPNSTSREVTLTYALNHSATMNLTVYKYNSDGSYSPVQTGSDTGTSGTVTLSVPMSAGNVSFFASVEKDDQFVKSEWVDFEAKATDIFGVTLSLLISALIILTLGLIAITEGEGTIVFVLLGVFLSGALGLMATRLSTGVSIVVYLILAGGLHLWKISRRRR